MRPRPQEGLAERPKGRRWMRPVRSGVPLSFRTAGNGCRRHSAHASAGRPALAVLDGAGSPSRLTYRAMSPSSESAGLLMDLVQLSPAAPRSGGVRELEAICLVPTDLGLALLCHDRAESGRRADSRYLDEVPPERCRRR